MTNNPVKIIQISDIHLMEGKVDELLGVPTHKSFEMILELLKKNNEKMDMILLTGDISQDGSDTAYVQVAKKLKEFEVPVYWVPGNHDDNHALMKLYPLENISNRKHIILKDWHLILLNSQMPEAVEGFLDQSQLRYMRNCLETYPEHDAIIVFHHHPLPVGSKWLDNLGLQNALEFWEIVAMYPKVNSVVFGHVHQESVAKVGNVNCYSVPSTCIQFKRNQDQFALDKLNPGYRWIHLYDNGKIKTGVKRTAKYVGKFESKAEGY